MLPGRFFRPASGGRGRHGFREFLGSERVRQASAPALDRGLSLSLSRPAFNSSCCRYKPTWSHPGHLRRKPCNRPLCFARRRPGAPAPFHSTAISSDESGALSFHGHSARSASERAAISPNDEDCDEIHPLGRDCDDCIRMALDLWTTSMAYLVSVSSEATYRPPCGRSRHGPVQAGVVHQNLHP